MFLNATVDKEVSLEPLQELPEKIVSLVDEHKRDIGQRDVVAQLAHALVVLCLRKLTAPLAGVATLLAVDIPNLVAVVAQIVLIVLLQLLEARLCHIDKLDARLRRGGSRLVAFGDVLFARASGLLHLVNRAVANLRQVMLQEIVGNVVDALRLLEGDEVLVVAFRSEKTSVIGRHSGNDGRDGSYGNDGSYENYENLP